MERDDSKSKKKERGRKTDLFKRRAAESITSEKIASNQVKTHRCFYLLICISDKASSLYVTRLPPGTTLHFSSFYFKKESLLNEWYF